MQLQVHLLWGGSMSQSKKKFKRNILAFALLWLGVYLIFGLPSGKSFNRIGTFLEQEEGEISQAHKGAHNILEVQKIKNHNTQWKVDNAKSDPDDFDLPATPYGVSVDDENFANRVNKDLAGIDDSGKLKSASPEYSVSKEVADDLYIDQRDYETQQAYIDAFLANARQAGYEVELNDNLDVVGVKKILKQEPLRFPQSVSPRSSKFKGSF